MGEGQRDVPDDAVAALNALDAEVEAALDRDDEAAFAAALGRLLDAVRQAGRPVADDVLVPSALVLPPGDATSAEVRHLFEGSADGLVPG